MPQIVIAAEYIDSDQNSTGYFWSRIVEKLRAGGFDVAVVRPGWLNKYDAFQGNPGLLKRLIKQILISVNLTINIIRVSRSGCVVFTGTNPTILLAFMPFLKLLFGIRWVLLVHDVFPDNLLPSGILSKGNPLFRFAAAYFSWAYGVPDKLLCIGRDMQSLIHLKTNGRAKTAYIPNWANGIDVYPLPRGDMPFFGDSGWEKHVVFQFFGNIGRVQGVANLLKAISLTAAENAAFVFIGGGAMSPSVRKFIVDNPQKNVKLIGPVSFEHKNESLALCDVALISLEAGMLGVGVPSKSYFSLAAGKPILAAVDAKSEIGLMLAEFPVGWRCDTANPQELADLIDSICKNPASIGEFTPREVFLENYSEEVVLDRILATLASVTQTPSLIDGDGRK